MTGQYRVLVLGAGITGLSSALRIQESRSDVHVTVMADKFSPHTCSDGAAGFWELIGTGGADDPTFINALANETYHRMLALTLSPLAKITGIQQVSGYQVWQSKIQKDLAMKDIVQGWREMTKQELARIPSGKDGRFFTTMTIDVTIHMKWLTDRIKDNGGRFVQRKLHSLSELSSKDWDVVVNCTSLGSYHLLGDHTLYPVRGQVFRVHAPWIKHFCIFDPLSGQGDLTKMTYILPNFETVVVGGVMQRDNWDESVNPEDGKGIWERATSIMPSLKEATILKQWVGLRPTRAALRLEPEVVEISPEKRQLRVVHNYGHGGSGITIHWGCAGQVTQMVSKFITDIQTGNDAQKSAKSVTRTSRDKKTSQSKL